MPAECSDVVIDIAVDLSYGRKVTGTVPEIIEAMKLLYRAGFAIPVSSTEPETRGDSVVPHAG